MIELTKSQKDIQKAAKDFAKGEFDKDFALDLEKKRSFPDKLFQKAADLGFIGIHFSEDCSGGGMGLFDHCLVAEEFCRKDSSLGIALIESSYGSEWVLRFASDSLKQKYLTTVAEGSTLSSLALYEPNNGSDLSHIDTIAIKDGDHWVISGKKAYVLNGGNADFYGVLCRTDKDTPNSLSLIIVDHDLPGVSFEDLGEKLGANLIATTNMTFDNVSVPISQTVGTPGNGFQQGQSFLIESRVIIAAQALGIAMGAFDRALDYSKTREQFSRKLAQFLVTKNKLATMATHIEMAKLATYHAAWLIDQGKPDAKLASMAKLIATRAALEVSDEAIQIFGGYGYITEYDVERYYRDAKTLELYEGNRQALQQTIADIVIGKIKS